MSKVNKYELTEHQLYITPRKLWKRLLKNNQISESKKRMSSKITLFVFLTAPFRLLQRIILSFRLKKVSFKQNAPVFVIGHWRSGTTHLHYLLAKDKQFSYLTAFQAFFFHISFVSKWIMKPILNWKMPENRPQDNVKISADAPTEEEHPLVNCTEKSGMQSFFFPRNRSYFDKYNLFEGIKDEEIKNWKQIYHRLLQKIALFEGPKKKLLLKNPHNTARIKTLIEMYPNAKFIFIHRNPYEVFNSSKVLYNRTIKSQFLQEFDDSQIDERIIYCYEKTLKKYLELRTDIPPNQLVEVAYDDLDKNPIKELEKIYSKLNLGSFEKVRPDMELYLQKEGEFKKNIVKPIPDKLLSKINKHWAFAFKAWDYQIQSN